MIGILTLNVLGYYGVFLGMHYRNDIAMRKALDADNYDQSHEITIKVAISIPYKPDQAEFKRVDGKFEHEGELYRLVKQRYAKDTLTVVCVKDTEHGKIRRVLADYIKTFSDKAPENNPSTKTTVNFLKDYLPVAFSICPLSPGWAAKIIRNSKYETLSPSFTASITHPPERPRLL